MKTFNDFSKEDLQKLRDKYDEYFRNNNDFDLEEGFTSALNLLKSGATISYIRCTVDEALAPDFHKKEPDLIIEIPDYLTPALSGKLINEDSLSEEESSKLLRIATDYLDEYGFEYN